jgi:hypothetical protein
MTRRHLTIISAVIILVALTLIAAAAGHPLFLINAYELD